MSRRIVKLSVLAVILGGFAALCCGQYRSRVLRMKVLQLPEPKLTGELSFEQILAKRRSVREFTTEQLNHTQIGQLAWAGQGITNKQGGFRTAPSAGRNYPITLYFAIQDGLYVYNPDTHSLEQTLKEDVRGRLAEAAGQQAAHEASCNIIVTGAIKQLRANYRKKARDYMLLEAGHVAQNIQLQAVSLDLGSVPIAGFSLKDVKKVCKLPRTLEPLYIICTGHPAYLIPQESSGAGIGLPSERPATEAAAVPRPRRAVMVVAGQNFSEEELFETGSALEAGGVETFIASSRTGTVTGMAGQNVEATILLNELRIDDFDAIVFIGGPGAREYIENTIAIGIVRQAADKGKVLAAISITPSLLANAGVLSGVRATSFASERELLEVRGAIYTNANVERDGPIVTANNPRAAELFAAAIIDAIGGR